MTVRELLQSKSKREVIIASPLTKIRSAMNLLIKHEVSCLPVLNDQQELVGILSDKDIFRRAYHDCHGFAELAVGELMTSDVIVGLETDDVSYIAGVMTKNRIRHVPIVKGNRLVGLISIGDVVKTQMTDIEFENRHLWQYINGSYPG
ncbi:MAG: CBS domain-containing protein [bacterium]|nr:CBS domain-containing protein [bacterium]